MRLETYIIDMGLVNFVKNSACDNLAELGLLVVGYQVNKYDKNYIEKSDFIQSINQNFSVDALKTRISMSKLGYIDVNVDNPEKIYLSDRGLNVYNNIKQGSGGDEFLKNQRKNYIRKSKLNDYIKKEKYKSLESKLIEREKEILKYKYSIKSYNDNNPIADLQKDIKDIEQEYNTELNNINFENIEDTSNEVSTPILILFFIFVLLASLHIMGFNISGIIISIIVSLITTILTRYIISRIDIFND